MDRSGRRGRGGAPEAAVAAPREVPSKLHYRIGEVAALVGVETHVLRYWEREFRGVRPFKSASGQRVYSRRDVELLMRVHDLLYRDGFTIAGAKKRLAAAKDGAGAVDTPDTSGAIEAPSAPDEDGGSQGRAPTAVSADEPEVRPTAPRTDAPMQAPMQAAPARGRTDPGARAALVAMRAEIERFLAELGAEREPSEASEPTGPTGSSVPRA